MTRQRESSVCCCQQPSQRTFVPRSDRPPLVSAMWTPAAEGCRERVRSKDTSRTTGGGLQRAVGEAIGQHLSLTDSHKPSQTLFTPLGSMKGATLMPQRGKLCFKADAYTRDVH